MSGVVRRCSECERPWKRGHECPSEPTYLPAGFEPEDASVLGLIADRLAESMADAMHGHLWVSEYGPDGRSTEVTGRHCALCPARDDG